MVPIVVPLVMASIEDLLERARRSPADVRFADLVRIAQHFFGEPRTTGSSHVVFSMPWQGDPRVNIQSQRGMAKPYQVRQVLKAIDRLREEAGNG